MLASLQHLAQEHVQVLCVSPLPPVVSGARRGFLDVLRAQAHRAIEVREAEDGLWLDERGAGTARHWNVPRAVWNRI
jgi:hypothetical protein